jgi:signal transduction histidine kinase/TolA-binding protein
MRLFVIYTLFFLCPAIVWAQGQPNPEKHDTAEINLLIDNADKILDPDIGIVLYNNLIKMCRENHYDHGIFISLMRKGIKYHEKTDYPMARQCFSEALKWAPRSQEEDAVAWCYSNIGEMYAYEGDYMKASEYTYMALDKLKEANAGPTHTAANVYLNLALINNRLNQPDKAMAYLNELEDICERGQLYFQLAETYKLKGQLYMNLNRPDNARDYFSKVMTIGAEIGKIDIEASAHASLGKSYIATGEYQDAIAHLRSAIDLALNRFNYIVIDASLSLGDVYYHMGRYSDAEAVLLSAFDEIKMHKAKDNYINYYATLSEVYRASGNYKKALECKDSLTALRETLVGAEKTKAINLMEIKYRTAEKDKQIVRHELLIAQQHSKIAQKNTWIAVIVGGVLVLTLLFSGLYRHKQRIQTVQIKTLRHENTISNLKGMVQGEDNERTRIARDLHDGVGGMLSAAMMRIRSIRHDWPHIAKIPAYIEAMDLLTKMADDIRKTAHNLMPDILLKQNIDDAVNSYCNYMQQDGTLDVDYQSYGTFEDLSEASKLNIYRIVQELLVNITRHAHASEALVQLVRYQNSLTITVEDNGVGFDTTKPRKGIGLSNLQTRVRNMGGQYTLQSSPGMGVSVFIEFELTGDAVVKKTRSESQEV